MIAVCPQCATRFNIPDDKYRPGRKARCSHCGNVFPLPELRAPEAVASDVPDIPGDANHASVKDELFSSFEADMQKALSEDAPDAPGAETAGKEVASGPSVPDFPDTEEADAPPSPSVEDVVLESNTDKPAKRSRKKTVIMLAGVFALLLLCVGGFLLYTVFFSSDPTFAPARKIDSRTSPALNGKSGAEGEGADAAGQYAVRRLALEKVRQYTVTNNPKTGRMVVIEGEVVNNFDTPKDLVFLLVTLYDEKGNALAAREQYCGVVLSFMQLTTMPKAALESALNNQTDIFTNNTNIPPGGRVSFMTVFFNLPSAAYEFEVKIADVKDPAPASAK